MYTYIYIHKQPVRLALNLCSLSWGEGEPSITDLHGYVWSDAKIYTQTCTYIYVYIYVYMYVYVYTYVCIYIYICVYKHAYMGAWIQTRITCSAARLRFPNCCWLIFWNGQCASIQDAQSQCVCDEKSTSSSALWELVGHPQLEERRERRRNLKQQATSSKQQTTNKKKQTASEENKKKKTN